MSHTFDLMKVVYSIFLLFLVACTQPPVASEEEAVKATLVAMWDAIEKGDADRYATYIHPDFSQFGENDSLISRGKAGEVEGIRRYVQVARNVHTEMLDPHVTIHGHVAWITYYWKDAGTRENVPFQSSGKSTRIFVKEDNRWLCIHGHYTNW